MMKKDFTMTLESIETREDMLRVFNELEPREDWHEPDEQGITVQITGKTFDNANVEGEILVLLLKDGEPKYVVNLATLFAIASGN